jgi:hypothetical protein
MKVDWFDNELIDELIDLFPNKDYDKASKEVKDYIKEKITLKDSLKENESSDLTVKWTKVYLDNENKDPYFYTEKGLADGFEMIKGQKVKEIVGYFEDEDGDEDYDIIGYIYSKGKKDIETDYNEDDLNDIFINSLSSMKESKNKHSLKENDLANDDLIYDRMLNMDQEQLISKILNYAEKNPTSTLVDYLNSEFGYEDEDY